MATSLLSSSVNAVLPSLSVDESRRREQLSSSPFICYGTKKLFSSSSPYLSKSRRIFKSPRASSRGFSDDVPIPKQFREENLKDGLMDNYKDAAKLLYGLSPSQMKSMFMTEYSPINQIAASVQEERISSEWNYIHHGGLWSLKGMSEDDLMSSSATSYRGGGAYAAGGSGGGRERLPSPYRTGRTRAPDLPSILLDDRIVWLGLPTVPAVAELIVAQLMYLDFAARRPISLYICSTGSLDENNEIVADEGDAYSIADMINLCKSEVHTLNLGEADGQAAMLMSLGKKGSRAFMPNATATLYLPEVYESSGRTTDMWNEGQDVVINREYYLQFLSQGTGKSMKRLRRDLEKPRVLGAKEAIKYGLADKIILEAKEFEKRKREPGVWREMQNWGLKEMKEK